MTERYVATFHTHVSALMTARALGANGVGARMAPVPRALSSSCGTCVFYEAEEPHVALMDRDADAVYRAGACEHYERVWQNA